MKSSYNVDFNFEKYLDTVKNTQTIHYVGKVSYVNGLDIHSDGPRCVVGEICTINIPSLKTKVLAEVVGLEGTNVKLTAFGSTKGIEIGCEVVASGNTLQVPVGKSLLGRVINATGAPIDSKGALVPESFYPAENSCPDPMTRKGITRRITTGVRAIDTLLTIGRGQRVGIFAGSGVGKSTLLSMIARNTNADVNVIALIGERGREVLDFINRDLGEEGLKRSVIIVATADEPSICRLRASFVATSIAEYFRDQGLDVMFMFDNLTRFAHAQREIGLAKGEPPAGKGYPPSVFDMIPRLLERTGTNDKGTITAFYNVLVDSDDFNEPITDKVRGTLDGHIYLTRKLAESYHYPAIDVLQSISRLSRRVTGEKTRAACAVVRQLMSTYEKNELMITTGAYQTGTSEAIDNAINMHDAIEEFLKQEETDHCTMNDSLQKLSALTSIEFPESEFDKETEV